MLFADGFKLIKNRQMNIWVADTSMYLYSLVLTGHTGLGKQ